MMDKQTAQNLRILVVDDIQKNIQLIGTILRNKGFLISAASSGKQALEIVRQNPVDLILLDIMMPEMNGFETCIKLKEIDSVKEVPIIFLSALSDTEDIVQGFEAGAVDYVTKPIQKDELLSRINTHLTIRTLHKQLQNYNEELEETVSIRTKELQKTKTYLYNIINSMPSILIGVDVNGRITHWNKSAEFKTGATSQNAIGQPFWEIFKSLEKYKQIYMDVIKNKKELTFPKEKLKDNRYCNSVTIFPLLTNADEGAVIRIDDITEFEIMENQLRQAQKMETIGTLAGGLAHDFNNVLGGIIGTLSLLKVKMSRKQEIPDEMMSDFIETMSNSGKRATQMVQQLLTLARKKDIQFTAVDMNKIILDVYKICKNTFDKSIEITANYAETKAMIHVDPMQIEQILLNLCINASHAMTIMRHENEKMGGKLEISIEKIFADIYFCKAHPEARECYYWQIDVIDTGIGMDAETVSKIFDPFFTTKEKGAGTGLGLAMVYSIIKQHSGFITVSSKLGQGTQISFFIPVYDADTDQETKDHLQVKTPVGEGLVFVVEDEMVMSNIASEILKECGYQSIIAGNGEEALEMFRQFHTDIDLVLLDLSMPKMSGDETYNELKKIDKAVKVIITSGAKRDSRVEKILDQGANDFIQKPYTFESLAHIIDKHIKP